MKNPIFAFCLFWFCVSQKARAIEVTNPHGAPVGGVNVKGHQTPPDEFDSVQAVSCLHFLNSAYSVVVDVGYHGTYSSTYRYSFNENLGYFLDSKTPGKNYFFNSAKKDANKGLVSLNDSDIRKNFSEYFSRGYMKLNEIAMAVKNANNENDLAKAKEEACLVAPLLTDVKSHCPGSILDTFIPDLKNPSGWFIVGNDPFETYIKCDIVPNSESVRN